MFWSTFSVYICELNEEVRSISFSDGIEIWRNRGSEVELWLALLLKRLDLDVMDPDPISSKTVARSRRRKVVDGLCSYVFLGFMVESARQFDGCVAYWRRIAVVVSRDISCSQRWRLMDFLSHIRMPVTSNSFFDWIEGMSWCRWLGHLDKLRFVTRARVLKRLLRRKKLQFCLFCSDWTGFLFQFCKPHSISRFQVDLI